MVQQGETRNLDWGEYVRPPGMGTAKEDVARPWPTRGLGDSSLNLACQDRHRRRVTLGVEWQPFTDT